MTQHPSKPDHLLKVQEKVDSVQPEPVQQDELDHIKQLLFGAILATYEVANLDTGESEPGLDISAAFEKQWKFIQPHLATWKAEIERKALDEIGVPSFNEAIEAGMPTPDEYKKMLWVVDWYNNRIKELSTTQGDADV